MEALQLQQPMSQEYKFVASTIFGMDLNVFSQDLSVLVDTNGLVSIVFLSKLVHRLFNKIIYRPISKLISKLFKMSQQPMLLISVPQDILTLMVSAPSTLT